VTTRAPLYATCARCSARVLEVRWDHRDNVLIGAPTLDPVGLDDQQILACVISDVPLWQVYLHAGVHVTSRRTRWWPVGPTSGHVAPAHRCGRVWDAFPLELAPDPYDLPDLCPF
jgi:hypothetical protein